MTHNRRIRFEVELPDEDPHIPSIVSIYLDQRLARTRDVRLLRDRLRRPTRRWTRIQMPDDWVAPAAQGLPLGGIPVEYRRRRSPPPE